MTIWMQRNEEALACRDAQRAALLDAWENMRNTHVGMRRPPS